MGDTQYRKAVSKIGKYRNTVLKIDEIPRYRNYDRSRLLKNVIISRVCLLQECVQQQQSTSATASIAKKREKTSN